MYIESLRKDLIIKYMYKKFGKRVRRIQEVFAWCK